MPTRSRDEHRRGQSPSAPTPERLSPSDRLPADRAAPDRAAPDRAAPEVVVRDLPGDATRVEPTGEQPVVDLTTIDLTVPTSARTRPDPSAAGGPEPAIDIRWFEDGSCLVELRGRATRAMLAEARDLLWSRSPNDRLTVVVSDAVLTRELFAMLIAGRRRLHAGGLFEIVGLDAQGARRIADRLDLARRR